MPVPYANRIYFPNNGAAAVIRPFCDRAPTLTGPIELVLDNNALLHPEWLTSLPKGRELILSPYLAIAEQWLSNPDFRIDAESRINEFIGKFEKLGARFRTGYAGELATQLSQNDAQLKYQHAVTFGYIAICRKLLDLKWTEEKASRWLAELSREDVPRFSGCLLLASLVIFLKNRQSICLPQDDALAYSYLQTFLAFHPKKKGEANYITEAYLRNRAGDLALWYGVPLLTEQSLAWGGEPVIVTEDKALHRLLFRLIPPVYGTGKQIGFSPAYREMATGDWNGWHAIVSQLNFEFAAPLESEKALRLRKLFEKAEELCFKQEEKDELALAYKNWL